MPLSIEVPDPCLVVLIGASGAGKSTFARAHFLPTEVVSSDACRAMVADHETVMDANEDAFALVHAITATRLRRGRLTVIDATNVLYDSRLSLLRIARDHDCVAVAIVLDMPQRLCEDRNAARSDRNFAPYVVRKHVRNLRQSLPTLEAEGFRHVSVLRSLEEVDAVTIERIRVTARR